MIYPLVFWVLIGVNGNTGAMVAQQFISEAGCNAGREFLLAAKGPIIYAKCIRDATPKQK